VAPINVGSKDATAMRRANRILLGTVVNAVAQAARTHRLPGQAMDIYNVTPADLDAAEDHLKDRERAWKHAGGVRVTDEQLDEARRNAEELQVVFERARRQSRRGIALIYLQAVHLFVLSRLPGLGKLAVIGGGTIVLFALSLIASPLVFSSFGTAFAGAVAVTVCASSLLAASVLLLWPTEGKRQAYHQLRQQWRERCRHVIDVRPAVETAWEKYYGTRDHWKLYCEFEKARQKRDDIAALIGSAKYQLIHMDWRSLRGEDFERFLSRVFEMLGYDVAHTKASADQGVDLVVTGAGRRIAVQAKGYEGSVSNHAVMEVVAGMTYYQCECCAVITNSRFTAAAEKLAGAHSSICRLVNGSQIVDLIEGRIY
jgi:HJR/Mrr/RecB family endonuclease